MNDTPTKFKHLAELQKSLADTSSINEKKEILNGYKNRSDDSFNIRVFNLVIDNSIKFYVTSKNVMQTVMEIEERTLLKDYSVPSVCDDDILNVYDTLSSRKVTGNAALNLCADTYLKLERIDPDIAKIFLNILDKDFSCGVNASILGSVFPLKRNFGVALANKYFDRADKVDFINESWYASRKCDGLRCICIKENGVVRFWSRQEKEFFTLGVLKDIFEKCGEDNFVLDGELCQIDGNGDEDFQSIMKLARRKDYTIEKPFYQLFDMLTVDEFFGREKSPVLSERFTRLKNFYEKNKELVKDNTKVLLQTMVSDNNIFNFLYDEAREKGWEGLMIRKDVPYEGKRTNDLLKVKDFLDDEFVVLECENADMRMVEGGRQVVRNVLANVVIDYKGNRVSVGSGFSRQQRIYYAEHPEELVGHTITVKYFEETTNQKGGASMRFPTVKCIYDSEGRVI